MQLFNIFCVFNTISYFVDDFVAVLDKLVDKEKEEKEERKKRKKYVLTDEDYAALEITKDVRNRKSCETCGKFFAKTRDFLEHRQRCGASNNSDNSNSNNNDRKALYQALPDLF